MYSDEYIIGYKTGFHDALDFRDNVKYQILGMELGKALDILSEHVKNENEKPIVIDVIEDSAVIIKRYGKIVYEDEK